MLKQIALKTLMRKGALVPGHKVGITLVQFRVQDKRSG
jgi:hypothetical protein